MAKPDFEAEGLLQGLDGEARASRLELLEWLHSRGHDLEALRKACAEDRLALLPVEDVLGGRAEHTLGDLAEATGLSPGQLERIYRANGLPLSDPEAKAFTDEHLEAARTFKTYLDAGIPMEGLLEASRVFGESASRAATAARELTARVLAQPGNTERDLARNLATVAGSLAEPTGRILGYLFAFHLQEQVRSAFVDQQAIASGEVADTQAVAIAFADLVDFTRLGQGIAPEDLGSIAERLVEITTALVNPPVTLVKTIGDAVMLASPDLEAALVTSLSLVEAVEQEGPEFPPVRAGVAFGEAFSRWGDWYGPPVNLASRICSVARPSSVLASEEVHEAAGEDPRFRWSFAGGRRLKGIKGEVKLHRCRFAESDTEAEQYA